VGPVMRSHHSGSSHESSRGSSHGGSSHKKQVMRSTKSIGHCIVAMKIGSFHFANSGRTSWSRPVPWPVF
jgi:hypothetical protein